MNLGLAIVSVAKRAAVIPQLIPFAEKMAAFTLGRRSGEDITVDMMAPDNQLWVLYEKDEQARIVGYIVTRIVIHPQARHLVLSDCGGEGNILDAVFNEFFGTIEEFARINECAGIEFYGRPGWKPYAQEVGMKVVQYQYFKSLRGTP